MTSFLENSYSIVGQDAGPQPTANELRNMLEVRTPTQFNVNVAETEQFTDGA
jgi:hypothetical protein